MFDRPAYLLFLAHAANRTRVSDYLAALPPLQNYGGRYLAVAPAASIERFGPNHSPQSLILSRWPSLAALAAFWHSTAHRTLEWASSQGVQVAAFEGELHAARSESLDSDEALAIYLGSGPSPALLEAEGARALALVRQAAASLFGAWEHGDIAIYAWNSAQRARRQLVTFSSGYRGRSMLVPALEASRKQPAREPRQQLLAIA